MAGQYGDCVLQKLALVGAYVSDSGIVGLPEGLVLSKDQLGSLKKELRAWDFPVSEWPDGSRFEESPLSYLLSEIARGIDPLRLSIVGRLDDLCRNGSKENARRFAAGVWSFLLAAHLELSGTSLRSAAVEVFENLLSPDDPVRRAGEVWGKT